MPRGQLEGAYRHPLLDAAEACGWTCSRCGNAVEPFMPLFFLGDAPFCLRHRPNVEALRKERADLADKYNTTNLQPSAEDRARGEVLNAALDPNRCGVERPPAPAEERVA